MPKKQQYRIRNWKDYNQSLVNRGSLIFWFDERSITNWHAISMSGQRGRPKFYSNIAIECALTIRAVFQLSLRATEGFIGSLIKMMSLNLKAPDYTTLSVRQKELEVKISISPKKQGENVHIVVDSTGLKVFGEGEWKVRQHGYSKRRTWRKLHLGVNAATHEIEAVILTTNDFKDSEVLPDLLDQIDKSIVQVSGDGGYDSHEVYEDIALRGGMPVIPPRKDAVIAQHGNSKKPVLARDKVIREIRQMGRKNWKKESNYHQRSLAETAMYRMKMLFGRELRARNFENQATEAFVKCRALNKMTQLGMPESYLVA